jgi:phosphoglycolate phosphatase
MAPPTPGAVPCVESLIFDLDGTLWNTASACTQAANRTMERMGLERRFSHEEISGVFGLTTDEIRRQLFPELSVEEGVSLVMAMFAQETKEIPSYPNLLYPDVANGLPRLASRYTLYMVSNCEEDYLETFMAVSGMRSLFRDTECYGRTHLSKGENIRLLISRNNIHRAAYVGDTEGDRRASSLAGIPFIFAAYGFGRSVSGCDLAVPDFGTLVERFMYEEATDG